MRKIAFTLAEILIVLVVIGVLTSILLPVAIQSSPDEKVMKFKKGNALIGKVISELVNNDKYYADGDLGKRADGSLLDDQHEENFTYFCDSFVDVVSVKSNNCHSKVMPVGYVSSHGAVFTKSAPGSITREDNVKVTTEILNKAKALIDEECASDIGRQLGKQIITTDGIVFYETSNVNAFGTMYEQKRYYGWDKNASYVDINGLGIGYKVFCMDIDGGDDLSSDYDAVKEAEAGNWLSSTSGCDDVKDICPFGYGIRADGKILTGARADEWISKSMQKGEN
mgnify:CR=1 FL=1